MRRARMALNVTCRLRMTSMTTGERGDAETVTPRSEGGGRKRASNGTSSAPYPTWSIRSETSPLRSERPRRKGEGMASGNEAGSWGKDAVVQWASAPGLVCEVLETEPAWEQARSTFLTHAPPADICVKGGDWYLL